MVERSLTDVLAMDEASWRQDLIHDPRTIGGSKVGAVLGLSPYASPKEVWRQMLTREPVEQNAPMRRGSALEPLALEVLAEQTGWQLAHAPREFVDARWPWLHASPDAVASTLQPGPHQPGPGIVEVKVPLPWNRRRWSISGVPPMYYAQLQQYLLVEQAEWGAFAIFDDLAWAVEVIHVPRDEAFIADLITKTKLFYERCIVGRQEPLPVVSRPAVPEVGTEGELRTDEAWVRAVERLRELGARRDAIAEEYEAVKEQVQLLMGKTEVVRAPKAKVTWRTTESRSIDRKALVRDHPTVQLEQYERVSTSRRFTVAFE